MTALTIRIDSVERFAHDGSVDMLPLKAGVNVLVGLKDTGKTAWLNTISFVLGDTGSPEDALGAGLATKFDSARLRLVVGGNVHLLLERRWKESGSKHRIFINGDGLSSSDFSAWLHTTLGIPALRFPKGNPYSGATWPELSWRMLFRHVYREERFWADFADKQPEKEQHACLLQFLGVASKVYSQELGDEIRQRQNLVALRARRDQFDEVLQQTARSLLADPTVQTVPTKESLAAGIDRLRSEIEALEVEREALLEEALSGVSASSAGASANLTLERKLSGQRVHLGGKMEELEKGLQGVEHRTQELSAYRTTVAAELIRLRRAEVAEEVFRPLSVTCCPHCDQKVSADNAAPGSCFVCHQQLPWQAPEAWRGAKRRLAFEHEQLEGEDEELSELGDRLATEKRELLSQLRHTEEAISAIDAQLRPTRTAVAALTPAGLQVIDTRIGQLEERGAQLLRLRETLEQRDTLAARIDELTATVQVTAAISEARAADISFEHLSDVLTAGINEYLGMLNQEDPRRWEHERVHFQVNERHLRVRIGQSALSSVGATSAGLVFLGYHYALLKMSGREGFNYPGLSLIDFPMTLADGTTTASKENYLLEPFVALAAENSTVQAVFCGRAFKGLTGVNRVQLDQVWTQGQEPSVDGTTRSEEHAGLELTFSANFHTRQEQIMMVLHHAEVVRLGAVLLDLGAAIAAGRTWVGKTVMIKWASGSYATKLIHHKDNGNVKFTVRKREARQLWEFLNALLRGSSPSREFRAVYKVNAHAPLDEILIDVDLAGS